jgi:YesN/AraC family two-component response regulator
MKLLLVDDEMSILRGLSKIIGEHNKTIQIITAGTSSYALELLRKEQFDLCITDINMPLLSGLDIIRIAKDESLCNHFVILSGYREFEYARTALKFQVQDYLLKPVNKEELLTIIDRVRHESENPMPIDTTLPEQMQQIAYINQHLDTLSPASKRCLTCLNELFPKLVTLQQLSDQVKLSETYISSLFSKELHLTFSQYLNMTRIYKSLYFLKNSNETIAWIAMTVGFQSERHYFKVFKSVMNQTPGNYRNNTRGGNVVYSL